MSVTIKDIAKRAGVSHTTVSRALRNHPAIAEKTKVRIQQLAREMNYVPNTSARELKTKQSKILGVLVTRIDDPFFGEVIQGIEDAITPEGYSLFLAVSNQKLEREKEIIQLMSERRVDGIIICSTSVHKEHQAILDRLNVTSVTVNNQAQSEFGHAVAHDDVRGAKAVTQHLVDSGYKRIGFLGNALSGKTMQDRYDGYAQTLQENGVTVDESLVAHSVNGEIENGRLATLPLLDLPTPPNAIVCHNDLIAIGAMQAVQQRGLSVPNDIAITGFDDVLSAAYVSPPLTTYRQPKFELGHEAAKMMLTLLRSQTQLPPQRIQLQGKLIVRGST